MKGVRISFLLSAMVLFTGLCSASAESLENLNQTELDQLAESEGLRFIHGWDWTSWVDYCKGRGATDDMFVAAFSKVARRTMGAEEETDDAYKCMKAMNVINEFNVAVSNLTTVVQVAKSAKSNRVRRAAASTYYRRTKGTEAFLNFAEDVLLSTNLQSGVEAEVISGLWHDAREKQHDRGHWGQRVSTLMRNYVENDVRDLDGADQILKWTDPNYATSPLRRKIRRRILAPDFKDVIDRHKGGGDAGRRVQMKYRQEEEEDAAK